MALRYKTWSPRTVCLLLLALLPVVAVADGPASEYAVKTAMVYKITKFVSWPESAFALQDSPLKICVAKGGSFAKHMQSLEGRKVGAHPIEVVTFRDASSVEQQCQVLVISRKEAKQAGQLLLAVSARPVLTIGDSDGFAEQGGIIGLEIEQSHVGFAINVDASQQVGLGINAQLLQLAKIIDKGGA
jgi:hypothetical protein